MKQGLGRRGVDESLGWIDKSVRCLAEGQKKGRSIGGLNQHG